MAAVSNSSGLGDSIISGMKDFLKWLPKEDLYSILKTTTNGTITTNKNEDEAIDIIVHYSDSVALLNRRRVTKQVLGDYLHSRKELFPLNPSKSTLCNLVLKHWGETNYKNLKFIDVQKDKPKPKPSIFKSSVDAQVGQVTSKSTPTEKSKVVEAKIIEIEPPKVIQAKSPIEVEAPKSIEALFEGKAQKVIEVEDAKEKPPPPSNVSLRTNKDLSPSSQTQGTQTKTPLALLLLSNDPSKLNDSSTQTSDDENDELIEYEESVSQRQREAEIGLQLSEQFSEWFYQRLNSLDDFGPQHFWPQCNLRIEIFKKNIFGKSSVHEALFDGKQCSENLKKLKTCEKIYFNPNLLPGVGVRGKINPHGLAQVMTCGTYHRNSGDKGGVGESLGVFEQVFGLMKDPKMNNNYKIKFSLLNLRENKYILYNSGPPALCDTSLCDIDDD